MKKQIVKKVFSKKNPSTAQLAARAAGAVRLKAAAAARKIGTSKDVISVEKVEVERHRRRLKELKRLEPKPTAPGGNHPTIKKHPFVLYS